MAKLFTAFVSRNVKEDHLENLGHSSDARVNTVMQEDYKPIEIRGLVGLIHFAS